MVMEAELLVVDRVDVSYGPVRALQQVSLVVRAGELVCLLGGNASGKSTTMKTILGLVKPQSGAVYFAGERIDRLKTSEIIRRGIASVPEARRIFPRMTVRENLFMGAYVRSDPEVRADAERILALFPRLRERLSQLGGTLSGGEQQMLAIARALMVAPRLLMLDEPSLGLAPRLAAEIMRVLAALRDADTTVLLVEQNAGAALSVADRAYLLERGRIALAGPAAAVAADPRIAAVYLGGDAPERTSLPTRPAR